MPVDIEDRHEDEVGMVEEAVLAAQRNVAQQHHPGVLAVDFARVNPGLDEQQWLCAGTRFRSADGIKLAALRGVAEHFEAKQRRGGDQPIEPRAGLGIGWRAIKATCLDRGDPRVVRGRDQGLAGAVPRQGRRQGRGEIGGLCRDGRSQAG